MQKGDVAPALAHVDVVMQRQVQAKQPPSMWQAKGEVRLLLQGHAMQCQSLCKTLEERGCIKRGDL